MSVATNYTAASLRPLRQSARRRERTAARSTAIRPRDPRTGPVQYMLSLSLDIRGKQDPEQSRPMPPSSFDPVSRSNGHSSIRFLRYDDAARGAMPAGVGRVGSSHTGIATPSTAGQERHSPAAASQPGAQHAPRESSVHDPFEEDRQNLEALAANVSLEVDFLGYHPDAAGSPFESPVGGTFGAAIPQGEGQWDTLLAALGFRRGAPAGMDHAANGPAAPGCYSPDGPIAMGNSRACSDAGDCTHTSGSEQAHGGARQVLARRNSTGRRSFKEGSGDELEVKDSRTMKKRIASRRRYAEHKTKLGQLQEVHEQLESSNASLREKLRQVYSQIDKLENGH